MPAPEPAKELNPQSSIEVEQPFPIFLRGTVIKGFGRGSKQLGIPTANLPQDTVDQLCSETQTGIYYGLALVVGVDETPRTMVMSVGWNPFYGNQKRSAVLFIYYWLLIIKEVHVINDYTRDFYGQELKVVVLGYLRPEKNYPSIGS